jgi:hypothetical protein
MSVPLGAAISATFVLDFALAAAFFTAGFFAGAFFSAIVLS